MASMEYFHSDMSNSTNMVVRFDEKSGNLCLRLRARSHIIYAMQVCLFYLSSCQILADEKSSIQAFMTGRNRNNNIMFVGFVYTSHIYSFGYGDYFQRK
jgi:hypothetical protein